MATTLRFRPVILGDPSDPSEIFFLLEGSDGATRLRQREGTRLLEKPLETISVEDLPVLDRTGRLSATLLPVQVATGKTPADAHERMTAALHRIRLHGARQARSA